MKLLNQLIFFLMCSVVIVHAHQLKENYVQFNPHDANRSITLNLEIETRLFEEQYSFIDDNHNEIVSYKELRNHKEFMIDYIKQHIFLSYRDIPLSLDASKITFHRYQDQTYMQFNKLFKNVELDGLVIKYDMFFEFEKNHKLIIHLGEDKGDFVLSNQLQHYTFSSKKVTQYQRLLTFVKEGVIHILDGVDHLLFILMILIPTFMLNGSYIKLLKIVTTFSIAHSLTLFISGFGIYIPSTVVVESAIALSIFIVAVLNFLKMYKHINYTIVFGFGLMHGFGFANVLTIAQVSSTLSFLVALFGFNLGVELGQVFVIVCYLLPLYLISRLRYKSRIIKVLSFATIGISGFWFLQRVGLV